MSVSIAEILRGAALQAVPLTGECAGYLVLAAADQALTAPRQVDAAELHLLDDGSVRAVGTRACSEVDAERDLRQLLDRLLSSASSVTPALLRAGRRAPGAGMAPLLREIERALIPVNRSAARRALARLEREAARAVESGRLTQEPPAPPNSAKAPPDVPPPSEPVTVRGDSVAFEASAPAVAPALDLSPVGAVLPAVAPAPETTDARSQHQLLPPPPSLLAMLPSLTPPPVAAMHEPARQLEVETRPEPIVVRASARPPAPPALHGTPTPTRDTITPVLGTMVQRAEDAPTWRPPAGDPGLEVRFTSEERTLFPDDAELIYAVEEPHDPTEPCPPVADTVVPPPAMVAAEPRDPHRFTPVRQPSALLAARPRKPDELLALDQDEVPTPMLTDLAPVAARLPVPVVEAPVSVVEAEAELELIDDIEILSDSEVAPVVAFVTPAEAPLAPPAQIQPPFPPPAPVRHVRETPHPRLAMPRPRPSDVSDLIGRLDSVPLPAVELRSELKSIAGLEPTPPPLGSDSGD